MHEENFLSSWLREDTEGKEKEVEKKPRVENEWVRKKWEWFVNISDVIPVLVFVGKFSRSM